MSHWNSHNKGPLEPSSDFSLFGHNKKHFDIALGELKIPLKLSESINNDLDDHHFDVQPICVGKNKHKKNNRKVYVAGWGTTGMIDYCITDKHGSR